MNQRKSAWALLFAAALVLTGCSSPSAGEDDDSADSGADVTAQQADDDADGQDEVAETSESDEAADPEEPEEPAEPEAVPFDPDVEVRPGDITARAFADTEDSRPFEHAYLPDDFVLPGTAAIVTWEAVEAPFDGNEQPGGNSGSAAFHLHDVTSEELSDFFTSRLPDQGWELEDLNELDGWVQDWAITREWDAWDEEWKFDEHRVNVTVRILYIPGDDWSTMQFHYAAERCVAGGC